MGESLDFFLYIIDLLKFLGKCEPKIKYPPKWWFNGDYHGRKDQQINLNKQCFLGISASFPNNWQYITHDFLPNFKGNVLEQTSPHPQKKRTSEPIASSYEKTQGLQKQKTKKTIFRKSVSKKCFCLSNFFERSDDRFMSWSFRQFRVMFFFGTLNFGGTILI